MGGVFVCDVVLVIVLMCIVVGVCWWYGDF